MKGFCPDCNETYYAEPGEWITCPRCGYKILTDDEPVKPETVHKDAVGNVLHVGDEVAFAQYNGAYGKRRLKIGTVTKLNPVKATITCAAGYRGFTGVDYMNVMKVIRENA